MKLTIPKDCNTCPFYAEGEDNDAYCSIYGNSWELPENYNGEDYKNPSCKVTHVEVIEQE